MYALFKYDLKKRQCFFSTCTLELIWPRKDMVTIEIPIRVPEYNLPEGGVSTHVPLEMMICRKRHMKALLQSEQFAYLKNFVGPVQPRSFKNAPSEGGLVVLAENEEAANHVVDSTIGELLAKFGETHIQEIHITDQKIYNNYPLWLKATLFIDTSSEEKLKESARLVKLIFQMVDKAVTLRLTGTAKAKADKARKAVEKLKQRQAAEENEEATLQKKRELEAKFVEKLKSLPPDQQRKLEEKKREKEMQKQKKRLSKAVKF